MDWVHCNNCYVQPGDVEKKKFFITNCGHIYCDECLQLNKSGECRICQVKYSTIPLSSDMNAEVEVYFHDPVVNLKKQMKVLEFQQSHRLRLVTYNMERLRTCKAIRKENYNLSEELKLCKKENEVLREEIRRLKGDFHEFKKKYQLTPASDISTSSRTKPMHSFSQFLIKDARSSPGVALKKSTPTDPHFNLNMKKPQGSNFFLMSEAKPPRKTGPNFTTPDLPRFPGPYRSYKTSTPDMSTPPTPDTFFKVCSQKDVLQRRVKLPSGPSPASRIGLHGLSLSKFTSTPRKENVAGPNHASFKSFFLPKPAIFYKKGIRKPPKRWRKDCR